MGLLKNFHFHRLVGFLGRILLICLFTLLLLEVTTRLVWWKEQTVTIFDKQITLLPLPLASDAQLEILEKWSRDPDGYLQFDPVLGWSIRPDVTAMWEGTSYTSNSSGIRSLREYDLIPPEEVLRIAAFGPSFTHCDEVQGNETWESQLEQARPDLEVMNWGVGGYGTDQAFLRYKTQGVAYQPDIVIIGYEEENASRNVNRFRPFYRPGTGLLLTKPIYITSTTDLILLENPFVKFNDFYDTLLNDPNLFIDQVCPHDIFCNEQLYRSHFLDIFFSYRFLRTLTFEAQREEINPLDEAGVQYQSEVTLQIVRSFIEEIIRNGSLPVVVVFPEQSTISDYEHGVLPSYYLGLVTLKDMGVPVIDLAGAFTEVKRTQGFEYQDSYASEGGHFNQLGNHIVAQTILWHLCAEGIIENCP